MAKQFRFTPVHEKYCQHYAEYGNATVAYLYAFGSKADGNKNGVAYSTAKSEGSKLLTNPNILERIEQLKEEFSAQFKQTKENTVRDLVQSAEEAKAQGQFSAYAKLRDMVIRLYGLYEPDKYEHKVEYELGIPGLDSTEADTEEDETDTESQD